jgi:hypothetical protein
LRVLGASHPHTLTSFAELGRWQATVGAIEEAITAIEKAVEGRLRALGAEHPDARAARRELDRLREVAQRPAAT